MFFFPQVWSENSQDHDDFVDDALKILRGESSDMFPESIIDQLFKDTFESDIFLTSGDDFAMDPLFFLSPEFDHGVNSLWKDWSFMNWSPAVFQNVFITYFEQILIYLVMNSYNFHSLYMPFPMFIIDLLLCEVFFNLYNNRLFLYLENIKKWCEIILSQSYFWK